MVWKGVIIEESLEDKSLLDIVKIIRTKASVLEMEEEKGEWHFHSVDVTDENVNLFVEKAKTAIKEKWWIHLVNGDDMIVILRGKSFRHKRGNATTLKEIQEYVTSQGVLQLPSERLFDNPYD